MYVHSNILTEQDIRDCVPSGCYLAGHYSKDSNEWGSVHQYGSRQRDRAYSVRLSGSGKSTMRSIPDKCATWDEWGVFIAAVFERDPEAVVGWYKTREDFMRITREYHERVKAHHSDMIATHQAPWLHA